MQTTRVHLAKCPNKIRKDSSKARPSQAESPKTSEEESLAMDEVDQDVEPESHTPPSLEEDIEERQIPSNEADSNRGEF